jgi:hypothetical protein
MTKPDEPPPHYQKGLWLPLVSDNALFVARREMEPKCPCTLTAIDDIISSSITSARCQHFVPLHFSSSAFMRRFGSIPVAIYYSRVISLVGKQFVGFYVFELIKFPTNNW